MTLAENLVLTETDYGIVLLDVVRGTYWDLNPSGALILRTLLDGGAEPVAARALAGEYEVDLDTAAADVTALVAELRATGILR
ncbi:lasso peptide biosynthesis PqqD family chaperone [Saccharopolyspora cebuensis]|uniref:Lasso peptide biosynthesis PqqD family chaperone n=1 Tax=Saccharopolyspora cebuensis TaxID=418759 RepID=A0ABV4CF66_9PSEU